MDRTTVVFYPRFSTDTMQSFFASNAGRSGPCQIPIAPHPYFRQALHTTSKHCLDGFYLDFSSTCSLPMHLRTNSAKTPLSAIGHQQVVSKYASNHAKLQPLGQEAGPGNNSLISFYRELSRARTMT